MTDQRSTSFHCHTYVIYTSTYHTPFHLSHLHSVSHCHKVDPVRCTETLSDRRTDRDKMRRILKTTIMLTYSFPHQWIYWFHFSCCSEKFLDQMTYSHEYSFESALICQVNLIQNKPYVCIVCSNPYQTVVGIVLVDLYSLYCRVYTYHMRVHLDRPCSPSACHTTCCFHDTHRHTCTDQHHTWDIHRTQTHRPHTNCKLVILFL